MRIDRISRLSTIAAMSYGDNQPFANKSEKPRESQNAKPWGDFEPSRPPSYIAAGKNGMEGTFPFAEMIIRTLIAGLTPFTPRPERDGGNLPTCTRLDERPPVLEIEFQVGSEPDEISALRIYTHFDHLRIDRDGDQIARFELNNWKPVLPYLRALLARNGWKSGD